MDMNILLFGYSTLTFYNFITVHAAARIYDLNTMPYERNLILSKHNQLRAQEYASNMQELIWDPVLADQARYWASTCDCNHSPSYNRMGNYGGWIGENLWWHTGAFPDLAWVIQDLYNEIDFYDHRYHSCQWGAVCGHYTQIIWARTCAVGCAVSYCDRLYNSFGVPNGHYVVCNYGPGGNLYGQSPYSHGPRCSQCGGYCVDGSLCASQCSGQTMPDRITAPPTIPTQSPTWYPATTDFETTEYIELTTQPVYRTQVTTESPHYTELLTEPRECVDLEKGCGEWATASDCFTYPDYMNRVCRWSCNSDYCRGDNYIPPDNQDLTTTGGYSNMQDGTCLDQHKLCADWAANGHCETNHVFMLLTCQKSCNSCQSPAPSGPGDSSCQDRSGDDCHFWVSLGSCQNHVDFMGKYCRNSCNLC